MTMLMPGCRCSPLRLPPLSRANRSASACSHHASLLVFQPGETAKTVAAPTLEDGHDDGGETFQVVLSNAEGAGMMGWGWRHCE